MQGVRQFMQPARRPGIRQWMRAAAVVSLAGLVLPAGPALAARVASVSPAGEVAVVRQVVVRFDAAVVPAGDPRLPAPFELSCNGATPPGDGRWTSDRSWVYDLREVLSAGSRCTLRARPAFRPLRGALEGATAFDFSTGAPVVVSVQPYPGSRIDEDQHFLLRLNGAADAASVRRAAWCEVEGLGERMPVTLVEGPAREALLRQRLRRVDPAQVLLLACQRPFPAEAGVRLVWGAGVAAAGQPGLVSRREQRYEWKVRPRFLAEFRCERENAQSPCMPLRPLVLRFNAPVARAQALAARLQPPAGEALAPQAPGRDEWIQEVRFAAPLAENARYTLTLPADLRDDAGRALANARSFPLAVATGDLPPLAKFPGGAFGIVEAGPAAMLPLTLRHVQADLAGASTGGRVAIKRFDAASTDEALLRWIARLQRDHETQRQSRAVSLLSGEAGVHRAELPQLQGSEPRATEVIGIPLPQRGYHVVEIESRILGQSLLARRAPMYARTGALVTNLGVHFKRGRSSSLVWVTSLDRGRPVPGARVVVNDCRGQPLWSGSTDAQGMAPIDRGFDNEYDETCLSREGHFVTARLGADVSFVFGRWNRGIEPWRFNLPTASGTAPDRRAHTVFDRTLLRAGETVSMKHFVRDDSERGLVLPPVDSLPDAVLLTHVGSGAEVVLPLQWPAAPGGARAAAPAAESRWVIPRNAALGLYDVALRRGEQRLGSGSLRVEAFRVPLVDARLSAPAAVPVAPQALTLQAQLNALAGGPMAAAPLQLSALLRAATPAFAGYEDFSFAPPSADDPGGDEPAAGDGSRLVADKLPAVTDRQGAAAIVVAGLPPLAGPSDLLAELGFTDPNGEVQTVTQRVRLWPSAVVAGLSVPRWAASRGAARFTAVVLDTGGQPLPGHAVEVAGRLQQTITTRKRIVGGFYAYDNRRETRELGTLCRGKTDAQGRLACDAAIDASGEVELLARARDDAGRLSEAASTVWISGQGQWWFAQDDDDRIDLLPEQREVEPGQTARLQVRMPFRQATALVTVEREGVLDARVMTLSGREPVIELPVPVAADRAWAPNVTVSVLVLRGRLREAPWWSIFTWGWREPVEWWRAFRYEDADWRAPTALADLARPSFKFGAAQLAVGLREHRLDVTVTPQKAQYGVRETVKTTVRVSHGGQPAAGAEIAFAAVDEGLLALQDNRSWDLLGAMMAPRPWGVETATAQGEIIGRRHYGRKALPPGGGGGHNPTRELFDTLLLWRGTVVLDAQGQAQIDVPLNDSLTSFRLVAVAAAGAGRFGTGSASVRVTQDLQLLPGIAPLARQGDRFDATFTLRNTTPRAMTVQATLAGRSDGQALTFEPRTVALAAGAAAELSWRVQVPGDASRIEWQAAADETGHATPARDRVKIVQVIRPAVPVRVWQASLQPLQGTLRLPVAAPADALPASGRVVAALQPRLGGALPGLRRYFETYPYTCLEQKVSRAIGLRDNAAWERLRDEAAGYLDADGLAGYFPPAPGDAPRGSDRLTAYLLSSAHEAGWAWPQATQDAMLRGLADFVEGRIERRFAAPRADLAVRKLAALDALARHGRATPRMLGSVGDTPAAWPTSALLDLWSVLRRVKGIPQGAAKEAEVQRLLRSRLVAGGTTLKFSTEAGDDWWWLMDGPDANAARLVLAAADAPGWHDDLPRLVNGTLARQRRGAWSTTTANVWGVLALERFAADFEAVPVSGSSLLQLGASELTLDWQAAPEGGTVALPLPEEPARPARPAPAVATASLLARHDGAGRPWLTLQTLAAVPLRAAVAAGYRVTRSVSAVQRKSPQVWSRGDILRVRLEVEAVGDMAWVVISDPVPAGATLLGGGLGRDSQIATQGERREGAAWPAYEEHAADAWRGYYEWLPRGRHVVEYTLRLNASGRFGLPPTRVEAMYAPETFGERPNEALEVVP